jgi:hypothetical protein
VVSYEDVARLLLPASGGGAVLGAGEQWDVPAAEPGSTAVVWGREPSWERAGPTLLRYAARRELALARLRRRACARPVGVHRWPLRYYKPRAASRLMWRLREGALVELPGEPSGPRWLDVAAAAAGVQERVERFHIGAAGSICATVTLGGSERAVLRVACAASAADPAHGADVLERLQPLGLVCVPRLLARGTDGLAAWTTESLLPGRPPTRISASLIRAAAEFCVALPRSAEPARGLGEHLDALAERMPSFAGPLEELRARTAPVVAALPSVLGHGDLWGGNLLVDGGRLTGVVDWDAWHPSAVPGTDLLHLVAVARSREEGRTFGELLPDRPWRDRLFAEPIAGYWRALGIAPTEEVLAAVGVAWWAAQTHSRLRRQPGDAADPAWLRRNVAPVIGGALLRVDLPA